eukprot:TRINITY_DN12136_c0_g1_i1.p1 TRINITY_DN12136_c0_g1~~TRINITY_DN12136_c0_g1_i1.p1  ORF type:complete len:133 (+),score=24.02 TRINITY_DN12136_c0_g1_i1:36-434(+)
MAMVSGSLIPMASCYLRSRSNAASIRCCAHQSKTVCVKKYKFDFLEVCQRTPEGIVCYRNGRGELICEGYDEGPYYAPIRDQEDQFRQDSQLYMCILGMKPYLQEGRDYFCTNGDHQKDPGTGSKSERQNSV